MTSHHSYRLTSRPLTVSRSSGFILITLLLLMLMIAIIVTISMRAKNNHSEDLMAQKESQQMHQITNGFLNYCQDNTCTPWPDDFPDLKEADLSHYIPSSLLSTLNANDEKLTFNTVLGSVTASVESSNADSEDCDGSDESMCKNDLLQLTLAPNYSSSSLSSLTHTLQKTASLLPKSNVDLTTPSKPTLTTETVNLNTINNNMVNITITSTSSGSEVYKPSCAEPYPNQTIQAIPISCVGIDPDKPGTSYPLEGCRIHVTDNADTENTWTVTTQLLTPNDTSQWVDDTQTPSNDQNWIRVISGCTNNEGS